RRLSEQMIGPDVTGGAPATAIFVSWERLRKMRYWAPLKLAWLIDGRLRKGFRDQLARLTGPVIVVTRKDDRGDTGPSVGGLSIKAGDLVVSHADQRRRVRELCFKR